MTNIYDIEVNLIDSNRIYEFYEWQKKDNIEEIEKIPLIRVENELLKTILDNNIVVDKDFLNQIYKKTEVIDNYENSYIEYACLLSNGEKTIAVEFTKDGESLYKSSLLLDEEEDINEIAVKEGITKIDYKILNNYKNKLYTRKEEYKINFIVKELEFSYNNKMYSKINYLYNEILPCSNDNIELKYNALINEIKNNYSYKYDSLIKIIKLSNKKKKV